MVTPSIQQLCLPPTGTIHQAIRVIDEGQHGIALIVDERMKLLGIVTDTDVRKALLRNIPLESPVQGIMRRDPVVGLEDEDSGTLRNLMESKTIRQLPIVDSSGIVKRVELLNHTSSKVKRSTPVVLMVGGKGVRLRPLTDQLPKPLLPIAGKPCLEVLLEHLMSYGFHNFYFLLNYKSELFIKHFGDGSRWGVSITHVVENELLGTAGGLRLLQDQLQEPFLVMNGDLFTRVNLNELLFYYESSGATATMAVREHNFHIPYGVIQTEDTLISSIDEKPIVKAFVNAGIYLLDPVALTKIPANVPYQMVTLFEQLRKDAMTVNCFLVREFWMDIGNLDEYRKANEEYEKWVKQSV